MLSCEVDWVVGMKRRQIMTPVKSLVNGWYDGQGHAPNVVLAARATTSFLMYQIAAPSAAAFLLPWQG